MDTNTKTVRNGNLWTLAAAAAGILINLILSAVVNITGLPLYLDTVGTVITAALCGWLPGVIVGLATNIINSIPDPSSIYYGVLNVLIASVTTYFARKDLLKKPYTIPLLIVILTLIGGGLGTFMPWYLDGVDFESSGYSSIFSQSDGTEAAEAEIMGNLLMDLIDKTITVGLLLIVLKVIPSDLKRKLRLSSWKQAVLSDEEAEIARHIKCRSISVRLRINLLITVAMLLICIISGLLSLMIFHNVSIEDHKQMASGVAGLAASVIDPEKVDAYIEQGEALEEYAEVEARLYKIRESSADIEYIYIYKIMNDGCHVVFDLDTDMVEGSNPGDIVPFDESFSKYLPALLAGEKIDPVISDDTYGWLMTVYVPVYDRSGKCVCYAAADVSMRQLALNERSFFTEMASLFLGVFMLILSFVWTTVEYNIIMPVNSIALRFGNFAYDSEDVREESVEKLKDLDIQTGDEIENLFLSILKTSEDSVRYVTDIQNKNETISQMQNALIMVLADMVESRDKNTGDHVRKTAAYVRIIMKEMKKKGYYADVLTEEFMSNVGNSAPLHDVGKIKVSDVVLNKPGKLTDEEFELMKSHTTAGSEIISQAIELVPDSGYLSEAKNLALYHHEKWNGKGYPTGISGEDIPLSARIMAVADVFDALVSKRSYKEPFTFEKAMDIIKEGSGSHFDPKIVDAFFSAEDEVRKIAEDFNKMNTVIK